VRTFQSYGDGAAVTTSNLPERATVLSLPMDDPETSVRSPALAALLSEGWKVIASLPAARGDRTELLLVLAPPRPHYAPQVPPAPLWAYLLAALACGVGAAAGSLLAGLAN
jgi:hypothetical protein